MRTELAGLPEAELCVQHKPWRRLRCGSLMSGWAAQVLTVAGLRREAGKNPGPP